MKSYNHLFEKLVDKGNIALAINRASKRKKKRPEVKMIYDHPEKHIEAIIDILTNGKYKPQTHQMFRICDGSSRKERFIIQPYFYRNQFAEIVYEQIIHHAVVQVLQPIIMRGMYQFSCGSIPNRGGHHGKKYLSKYIREHNGREIKYCLKLDIRHFYDSIDIDVMKNHFASIIHDEKMLKIINTMIESNVAYYQDITIDKGLRIGTYFVQWFANFLLQGLDHYIKEDLRIKCYVRYVDDMVILAPNKRQLHSDFIKIKDFLFSHYGLTVKDNWQIFKFDYIDKNGKRKGRPIDYMGFKFYRDKTTLRKRILRSSTRKARKICKAKKLSAYESGQIMSYRGWYKTTDTYKYFKREIARRVNFKKCRKAIRTRQIIQNKEIKK